jgi:hypothetical protein
VEYLWDMEWLWNIIVNVWGKKQWDIHRY